MYTKPTTRATIETPKQSWQATKALAKATLGLLNPRIWFLSLLPLILAGGLWTVIAYFGWDAANDVARGLIGGLALPDWMPDWLPNRSVVTPFIVLLLVFPLVLISALIAVGICGTGAVARRVAAQYNVREIPRTALEKSTVLMSNVWHSTWVMLVLGLVWLFTLPLWLFAGAGMLVALVLLGWANARLFSRDVLSDFATAEQRQQLMHEHRSSLWGLGLLASVPAAIPTLMWVSGALAFIALPVMALAAVWLSIMVFLATSLLFSHYLLPALAVLQAQQAGAALDAAAQAQIDASIAATHDAATQRALDAQAIETSAVEVPAQAPALSQPAATPVLA